MWRCFLLLLIKSPGTATNAKAWHPQAKGSNNFRFLDYDISVNCVKILSISDWNAEICVWRKGRNNKYFDSTYYSDITLLP